MTAEYFPADIAIVGMSCRVPGATTPDQFWSLLRDGRESRLELDDQALRAAGVPQSLIDNPDYVKATMPLQQMEYFDPGFFGFSPLDGRILDPQHRHFLECSWEALEDAGCDPARFDGAIGVFAGSGHNTYLSLNLLANPDLVAEVGLFLLRHTGNDKDFLATRVSYCFDLRGPSVNVQTACSTSLVAIHAAAQSLINGECDMALAGGVTIELPHRQGYLFKDSEILSRDGHCRPFDASAGGTLFGSGVGVVVLRRMTDAIAAGDNIHGVLRASAINNDGGSKVSYLAPSVDGQAAAIEEALSFADIDPRSVTYIEAHGTGTQLGDPIEVAALTQAYGRSGDWQYCGIGSVKSNIGHLDTAAGVASLIKVLLSMRHRQLPPTLHWTAPNEAISFSSSPFYVNSTLQPWAAPAPLRAGVSSLGVGGTNAHLIVEEPPVPDSSGERRGLQLLLFSARSEQSLLRGLDRMARHLEGGAEAGNADLADAAFTLAVGRRPFQRRAFLIAADAMQAASAIDAGDRDRLFQAEAPASSRGVVFMFAGGGAQYQDMGRGLYESEPVYRTAVDECAAVLQGLCSFDLKALLLAGDEQARREAGRTLERPSRALPALFVVQYAQARLWQSWGVTPEALIGHSMGENTAACLAGVLSLRDALGLVALRGQLFESVEKGSMLSVDLGEAELTPLLGEALSIAAVNAPGLSVASGPQTAIDELEAVLSRKDIGHRRIRIDVAAHSKMLEGILAPFGDYLRSIRLDAPKIPFISNRSGTWITDAEATDPGYWVRHLRDTVRFAEGATTLLEGQYVLLEVGPGRTLASLAGQQGNKRVDQVILNSMRHPDDATPDLAHMLQSLGRLWMAGAQVDWSRFYGPESLPGQKRRRVSLPTYAFDHQFCWIEAAPANSNGSAAAVGAGTRRTSLSDWLYHPVWHRTAPLGRQSLGGSRVLLLEPSQARLRPVANALAGALESHGAEVRRLAAPGTRIGAGEGGQDLYASLDFGDADGYVRLADRLLAEKWTPTHVVHALCLDLAEATGADGAATAHAFDSLFHLAQICGQEDWQDLHWLTVTAGAQQVAGEVPGNPLAALGQGPMRVLPNEFPSWRCGTVDVDLGIDPGELAEGIAREVAALGDQAGAYRPVALRGQKRAIARFEQSLQPRQDRPQPRAKCGEVVPMLRAEGVYLITGGTGGLGLVAARSLERAAAEAGHRIRLVLLSRRALPAPEHWDAFICEGAAEATLLKSLRDLEGGAADVILETGDVSDIGAMRAVAERLRERHGGVRGILHAAGVVNDALLLGKDIADARQVLMPKVQGTLALASAFDAATLDFLVLYSSTSAFAGLPGQIDYAAANSFLDAFAHKACATGANVIAIDWPAWRDAGMAASLAAGRSAARLPAGRPVPHPLIDRRVDDTMGRVVFATDFSLEHHWILQEHRIKDGPALIPGSAFVEIARAAWSGGSLDACGVHIEAARFELPFAVGDNEHKTLFVELQAEGDSARFALRSDSFGDSVEHVSGKVSSLPAAWRPAPLELHSIRSRCMGGVQRFDDATHHPFLDFGPRWAALRCVHIGSREALVDLELPERFAGDLQCYGLHPALYDMATAGAQVAIEGYEPLESLYVPVGCDQLDFDGAFPVLSHSHVSFRGFDPADPEIAVLDIRAGDASGRVFLEVRGFRLRRVADVNSFRLLEPRRAEAVPPVLARTLELGIDAAEGSRALLHVLGARLGPQTVVSAFAPDYLQAELLKQGPGAVPESPEPLHNADGDPDIPELERVLGACEAVGRVIVRSFLEATGERRLVAYFEPDLARFTTISEVRKYARAHLAADMQPQQFVELDHFPAMDDGAVDRGALSDPLAPADTHIAPRTTTEKVLARIWQDALGMARVGLADNFFDLGGHSLLSTRVIVQVYKRMGVRLDQASMVLGTLEQIARDVDTKQGAGASEAASLPAASVEAVPRKRAGLLGRFMGGR